uniref:Uncharacterized protein n=1 Tax=viral metagenome TaxID=1070528 RepID=A0A6M3XNG9_9ZZZZ
MAKHRVKLIDSDTAASAGIAVYVVPNTYTEVLAHFESTTANNADIAVNADDDLDAVLVTDNDAPGGVQVYVVEGETPDRRLQAVIAHNMDVFVPMRSGQLIRIVDNDDAATDGVALYCDDDAADVSNRLLFVSPSDTSTAVECRGSLTSVVAE